MLVLVYYLGAEVFLIDPTVMELEVWQAVGISLASLAFGWVACNTLCNAFVNANQTVLMVALFGVLVAMSWVYTQVISGRAAMLHPGAITASIMSGKVFFVIMPKQRAVVADLKAGRKPDPKYGKIAKQRSTHNTNLTLPVDFLMLSNHYPLIFATKWNWMVARTEARIAHEARRIYLQAGVTHAMPPGNLSFIEPEERAKIVE